MLYLQKLGEKIKKKRIEKGYTQEELAKAMGYTSRSTINKIEKGLIDIPQSKLIEFANIFNCSPLYLMNCEPNIISGISIVKINTQYSGQLEYMLSEDDTNSLINYIEENLKPLNN